jgi:hypothetical protein
LLKLISAEKNTQCFFFDSSQRIVLRADCVSERLSLQSSLIDGFVPPPPLGEFARSFPDVDDLAKHLTALSLDAGVLSVLRSLTSTADAQKKARNAQEKGNDQRREASDVAPFAIPRTQPRN